LVSSAAAEIAERKLECLAEADTDGEAGITLDELTAHIEAKQAERVDAAFARLDADESDGITAEDVSERRWEKVSVADAEENGGDGDGTVSQEEFASHLETKRAERQAAAEDGTLRSFRRGGRGFRGR
jgi:hypothetical protein